MRSGLVTTAAGLLLYSARLRQRSGGRPDAPGLWDRLFGTFHMPAAKREPLRFGLGDAEPSPHGLNAVLVRPVTGAVALIGRRGRDQRGVPA